MTPDGAPAAGSTFTDETGNDVPPGEVGEVVVRSPALFRGYWRNPEATAAAHIEGWYRTGDLARCGLDGYVHLVDRAKDMIVSGGENVYSAEVERAISQYPDVALVALVGLPDERWGERVVAVVVAERDALLEEDAIKLHCRDLLAGYKVPKSIYVAPELPLTANGKVHKPTLRASLAESAAAANTSPVQPVRP